MSVDRITEYEKIRSEIQLVPFSPEKMLEMWRDVFPEGRNDIRREKFVNMGGVLTTEGDSVLGGASLTNSEDRSILLWGGERIRTLVIDSTSSIGIQTHEDGTKSVVVVRSSPDKDTGVDKQTTRRFTAIRQ